MPTCFEKSPKKRIPETMPACFERALSSELLFLSTGHRRSDVALEFKNFLKKKGSEE